VACAIAETCRCGASAHEPMHVPVVGQRERWPVRRKLALRSNAGKGLNKERWQIKRKHQQVESGGVSANRYRAGRLIFRQRLITQLSHSPIPMVMCFPGAVLERKASKAHVRAPHMLPRSQRNQRRVRPWSMVSSRSMFLSRVLALVEKPRYVLCRPRVSQSLQLQMLHLFHTMVVGHPREGAYNLGRPTLSV